MGGCLVNIEELIGNAPSCSAVVHVGMNPQVLCQAAATIYESNMSRAPSHLWQVRI